MTVTAFLTGLSYIEYYELQQSFRRITEAVIAIKALAPPDTIPGDKLGSYGTGTIVETLRYVNLVVSVEIPIIENVHVEVGRDRGNSDKKTGADVMKVWYQVYDTPGMIGSFEIEFYHLYGTNDADSFYAYFRTEYIEYLLTYEEVEKWVISEAERWQVYSQNSIEAYRSVREMVRGYVVRVPIIRLEMKPSIAVIILILLALCQAALLSSNIRIIARTEMIIDEPWMLLDSCGESGITAWIERWGARIVYTLFIFMPLLLVIVATLFGRQVGLEDGMHILLLVGMFLIALFTYSSFRGLVRIMLHQKRNNSGNRLSTLDYAE